jgi:hypothetical protein
MVGVLTAVAAITVGPIGGRYPWPMARRCARPDCSQAATTTLSYEYETSTVWLTHLTDEAHPMTHDMCEAHADRMSVPRGWQLRDRRDVVPLPLFGDNALAS